ncbi:hypothetical protein AB4Y45_23150 [Paraburkholderia sp. EG287A]|uniref:hypothetical protein n=1 Tax=Paraburkholderia sp. EG287A TaxID=3237012 RepID=UPI0034D3308A
MKFFELPQTNPCRFDLGLPEKDSRNFPHRLSHVKQPTDSKLGECGVYVGIKGTCVYHSQTERIALHFADFNTLVGAIRTHLPVYNSEKFRARYEAGMPIPVNSVATIDLDLPYFSPHEKRWRQHGVSCKDTLAEFKKRDVARRALREQGFYDSIGGTWEPVEKAYFPAVEYDNYEYILTNIKRSDVITLWHDAKVTASLWMKDDRRRSVRESLAPFSRALHVNEDHVFRLTCIAIYLGHLRLNHRHKFELSRPLDIAPGNTYLFERRVEPAPWGLEYEC